MLRLEVSTAIVPVDQIIYLRTALSYLGAQVILKFKVVHGLG